MYSTLIKQKNNTGEYVYVHILMYYICKTLHTHILIATIAIGSYNVPHHYNYK